MQMSKEVNLTVTQLHMFQIEILTTQICVFIVAVFVLFQRVQVQKA